MMFFAHTSICRLLASQNSYNRQISSDLTATGRHQQPMAAAAAGLLDDSPIVPVLEQSQEFWQSLPFHYLFIGHALYCALPGGEFKDKWLVHLLLTFLWGNGGGIVTAALIMQPKVATFSFFQADFILGSWIVCWWLVNWAPGGLPAKLLNVWWIKMLAMCCTMLSRAQLIVSRVDLAVQLFPGVAAAPLILGTLSGCGGRLLADAIMTSWQTLPGLAELSSPGFVSRSAAFAAVSYYTLAYATRLLPAKAAAGLVVTGLMLHAVATGLTGLPLDFTAPVTQLLHTLTRVPAPPPQPQPAPVTVSTKRVTPKKAAGGTATPHKSPAAAKSPAATTKKSPARNSTAAAANDGTDAATGEEEGNKQQRAAPRKRTSATATAAEVVPAAAGVSGGVTTRRRAAAAYA